MLPTSPLSPTQFDVFLTCLGLTRGPCLLWHRAAGASICIAHIMGMTHMQIPVSEVFRS